MISTIFKDFHYASRRLDPNAALRIE